MFMELLDPASDIKHLCSRNLFWLYLCTYFSEPCLCIFSQTLPVMQSKLHMLTGGPASEASIIPPSSLLQGGDGRRPLAPVDMRHAWKHRWSHITHSSSSPVAESKKEKKKVWKVQDMFCSVAVSRGFLLWVSVAFTGYANISTSSFCCTWRGFGSPARCSILLNPVSTLTRMFE